MKTAVSIPDPIFHAAESLAQRLGMSRSELFSRALEAYLETHKHDSVCEALNAIYSQESSSLDETLAQMQWASLPKEDW
jgi:metal-responsive CopG/Arc/MetJ family transcriptional regulator